MQEKKSAAPKLPPLTAETPVIKGGTQMIIKIPQRIVDAMEIGAGDKIFFSVTKGTSGEQIFEIKWIPKQR